MMLREIGPQLKLSIRLKLLSVGGLGSDSTSIQGSPTGFVFCFCYHCPL